MVLDGVGARFGSVAERNPGVFESLSVDELGRLDDCDVVRYLADAGGGVAANTQRVLDQPTNRSLRAAARGGYPRCRTTTCRPAVDLGGVDDVRRLAGWLAAVHDVGEASPASAVRDRGPADAMRPYALVAHPRPADDPDRPLARHELVGQRAVQEFLADELGVAFHETVAQLGCVVGGHHGVPPESSALAFVSGRPDLTGPGRGPMPGGPCCAGRPTSSAGPTCSSGARPSTSAGPRRCCRRPCDRCGLIASVRSRSAGRREAVAAQVVEGRTPRCGHQPGASPSRGHRARDVAERHRPRGGPTPSTTTARRRPSRPARRAGRARPARSGRGPGRRWSPAGVPAGR